MIVSTQRAYINSILHAFENPRSDTFNVIHMTALQDHYAIKAGYLFQTYSAIIMPYHIYYAIYRSTERLLLKEQMEP